MAKIPKYYVRPDGLHESILRINGKRKAFRGKTDTEVYNKIKAYSQAENAKPKGILFKEAADAWWKEIEPSLEHIIPSRAIVRPMSAQRPNLRNLMFLTLLPKRSMSTFANFL